MTSKDRAKIIKAELFRSLIPLSIRGLAAFSSSSEKSVIEEINMLRHLHKIEEAKTEKGLPTVRLIPNSETAFIKGKLFNYWHCREGVRE